MKIRKEFNSRTVSTRTAIGNAILDELENTEFSQIKVMDVIRRAGVSRMTFYRYYENLYDALCDYLDIIVTGYMIEGGEIEDPGVFMRLEHIEFSLNYFDRLFPLFPDSQPARSVYGADRCGQRVYDQEHSSPEETAYV